MVINMRNPNALIAMAQVSQNANNPYEAFCEYIKYCVFSNVSSIMTLAEIRMAVGKEFGLYIPHNVLVKCLSHIQDKGVITFDNHRIRRVGSFDTESFDREREMYRSTEGLIIQALMQYALKYNREWTVEYARELLIKVLDRSGLAYDIFLHEDTSMNESYQRAISLDELEEMLPDDEEIDTDDIDSQPLFTDEYFVGKFIVEILAGDTVQKDYLKKICEGLMLCVGTYQLPSAGTDGNVPRINGTKFFFDTKLLLRFLGCANEAAVSAAAELVALIQNLGGKIYYYQQTLGEMERAFDNAIKSLNQGKPPVDDEMRMYAISIQNNPAIMSVKKAALRSELASEKIYLVPHENFTDVERIRFGFDREDLQQYMRSNLTWDTQVIDNDALAIWETHMRRGGDYSEYCGTSAQLPVFVTTNSRLIRIALKFREDRSEVQNIHGWKQNRLPVITDIRLTCRLWTPSTHSERMALLYLTANAVAAKRPTKHYLNSIRKLAVQLGEQAPQYSELCLPAYFDDIVTDTILQHTMGDADKLNINTFANSIGELSEWRAKEQEKITNQVIAERDGVSTELKNQTQSIIEGAVESGRKLLKWRKAALWLVAKWYITVTIIFTAITAGFSLAIGNWHSMWAILLPVILGVLEICGTSNFVGRYLTKWLLPIIDASISRQISKKLRRAEQPYKDIIIQQVKEQTAIWVECKELSES